jgi:nicotinamide-nucleotide amidase
LVNMHVSLLTIGTELTRGDLLDQNSKWLAQELGDLGYEVIEIRTVDDEDARIIGALRELGARSDLLLVTGGLGPTSDDRTAYCAAQVGGVPLVRDVATLEHIQGIFARYGRVMHPMNAKQADFPQGATILPNELGTAAGFSLRLGRALAFFTPGVPTEMQHIFHTAIRPRLPVPQTLLKMKRLTVYGVPESEVAGHLDDIEAHYQVVLGYRASPSEIEVKVMAQGETAQATEVEAHLARAFHEVESRLGHYLTAAGRKSLAAAVLDELLQAQKTLALAESCTGGGIAQALTHIPGSSAAFRGGVVAYDNVVKRELLGVSSESLAAHGAVSREVALEMADGARKRLHADLGLSVTGIAGPGGGSPEKPVGLVHIAVSTNEGALARVFTFRGDREQVRRRASAAVLALGLEVLRGKATVEP